MHPFWRITCKCHPALWANELIVCPTYCLWHLAHKVHEASGVTCELPVNIVLASTKPASD